MFMKKIVINFIFFIFLHFNIIPCGSCKVNDIYINDAKSTNADYLNNEFHLSSGLDINVPLNIKWADCNCSYLSVLRFFFN